MVLIPAPHADTPGVEAKLEVHTLLLYLGLRGGRCALSMRAMVVWLPAEEESDCDESQVICDTHGLLSRTMALSKINSFRMQAVMATLGGFPEARSR